MDVDLNKYLNVLIVDDSTAVVSYTSGMLSQSKFEDFRIESAGSLDSAFEILKSFKCDVVLLDLNLKNTRGLDTFIQMKSRHPDLPIIVLTGEYTYETSIKAMKMGAQDFLVKDQTDIYSLTKAIKYAVERKKAELKLLESEERYRSLFEASGDGILIVNTGDQTIKYVNPAMVSIVGYSEEEIIGRNVRIIHPEEKYEKIISEIISQARGKKKIVNNIPCLRKDGAIIYADVNSVFVTIDGIKCNLSFFRDISERKQKEDELSIFRRFTETSQLGHGWTDLDGNIMYVNQSLCDLAGEKHAENIIGNSFFIYFDRETGERFKNKIFPEVLSKGQWRHETTFIDINGKEIPVFNNLFLLRDSNNNPQYFAVVLGDIRERIRAEQERLNLEKQLQQSRILESIGTLASGIAHEINTPMQYIGDNTFFFSEGVIDLFELINTYRDIINTLADDPKVKPLLEKAEKAVKKADLEYLRQEIPSAINQSLEGIDRVKKILNAMKFFSHIDSDVMVKANINQAIESSGMVSKNEWKYVADLETRLDPDIPEIMCYIGEINQVMMNLIVNAAHAIAEKTGKDSGTKGLITIISRKVKDFIEITVKDTGTGIPDNIRDKIFDPFFTTKDVGKGTGQGLAIAYDVIVRRHKGNIYFESEPGEGTSFIIRLPIMNDPAEQ